MQRIVMVASVLSVGALCGYLGAVHPAVNSVQQADAADQTKQVARAATAFLNTLSAEQRQKVAFDFIPKKAAVIASFHRTSDGGVAPGAPTASAVMKGPTGPPPGNAPEGGSTWVRQTVANLALPEGGLEDRASAWDLPVASSASNMGWPFGPTIQ